MILPLLIHTHNRSELLDHTLRLVHCCFFHIVNRAVDVCDHFLVDIDRDGLSEDIRGSAAESGGKSWLSSFFMTRPGPRLTVVATFDLCKSLQLNTG